MCGICGLLDLNGRSESGVAETVRGMCSRQSHRGPDAEGLWHEGGVALGHRRLSIIDLVGSIQPMCDASDRYVIIFNGEIYNYLELRSELEKRGVRFATRGDTEVLLQAFIRMGSDCLQRLNGMFAFAVWDRQARRLFAARDRLGVKPLFYGIDRHGRLAFASELQALRKLRLDTSIRWDSLSEYLRHGFIRSPKTVFQGIHELRPGHFMVYGNEGLDLKRYWEPPLPDGGRPDPRSLDDHCEELKDLFHSAVRIRLRSDVPLGAFLSGGLDSSIVVSCMKELGESAIHTFSIGFDGIGFDESPFAQRVANHFGTQHHERRLQPSIEETLFDLVRHYGQPYGDSSAVPTWHLSRMTREHVTVALSGDGGDELFCGYRRYVARRMLAWYRLLPAVIRKSSLLGRIERLPEGTGYYNRSMIKKLKLFLALDRRVALNPDDFYPAFFSDSEIEALLGLSPGEGRNTWDFDAAISNGRTKDLDEIERMMLTDVLHYLPDDILTKVDRASMAHSLEVRSPFMDYRIVEYAARLPLEFKLRGLTTKYILRKAFESNLPSEPLTRSKHGFAVPLGDQFHGPLKKTYQELVLDSGMQWVEKKRAGNLLAEHLSGRVDHGHKLWLILFLHGWAQWWNGV